MSMVAVKQAISHQVAVCELHSCSEVEHEQRTQLAEGKMQEVRACARVKEGKEQVGLHEDAEQQKD